MWKIYMEYSFILTQYLDPIYRLFPESIIFVMYLSFTLYLCSKTGQSCSIFLLWRLHIKDLDFYFFNPNSQTYETDFAIPLSFIYLNKKNVI